MIRIKLLFILPLVVAVTVAQTTGGYTYYGSSNVRVQRPQPIYGRRPLVLPLRPVPTTRPVTQGPVAPTVTESPAAPAEIAPIIPDSEATAAPAVVPALAPRPIYTPTYRPLLPPRPLRPSPLVVAPPQPAVISEPQPTIALPPVTETVLPVQPVEVSTSEAIRVPAEEPTNSIIQPLPAATIPQPEPIHHGYGINDQIEPISQPEPIREPEPFPQPEPVRQPEPVPQPEPVRQDEPVRQPEPIPQPEPVRQDEPVMQPEPIPQPEPVRQAEPTRQPELVLQPEPVWQPEPIPQPKPIPQPEPIRQPELVLQPEPVQQPEPQPEPISQPEVVPVLELTRESELAEEPKPALVAIPTGTVPNRLVALPPLLPKPQPVRETAFGRHPQHTPPPMNYRPTFAPPTYTYPPARPVTQPPPVRVTTLYQPPLTRAPVTQSPVTQSPVSRPVTQAPGHIVLDFQCKEENGYYSVIHQCDSYIECKGGRAMQYACPDGLHFNPAAKKFEYPCAYPSEVQCMAGDEEQDPKPSGTCPNQYGFYSMNDGDCSKFIMCQEGLATIMDCPMGLVFNPRTSSCDWPANVPQCNPSVFKDFTCPAAPLDENGQVSDIILNYRFYADCKLYIACQLGRPRLLSCDPGLSFDEASQTCINEDYVADCAVPYSSRH